jgi:hypothetical protein
MSIAEYVDIIGWDVTEAKCLLQSMWIFMDVTEVTCLCIVIIMLYI